MVDRQPSESFSARLLRADDSLHTPRYEEHRMQLEQQLARAEVREKIARHVVIGAIVVAVGTFPLVAGSVFGSPDPYNKDATAFSVALGVIYFVAMGVVLVGTASFYSRFMPRVRRTREALRDDSIRELSREVGELRRLVERQAPERDSDPPRPE
jgi:hypothetical protein